ncbi:MAG: hypothetical protein KC621_29190 [Myxococcales bacterium]|nr:hypothetical protein [Myxococcales bacterium]
MLLWLAACGDPPPPEPVPVDPVPQEVTGLGWITELAWHPDRYATLTGDDQQKAGWEAFRAHDLLGAWGAFPDGVGRARTAWEMGVIHDDLARLSADVNEQLWTTWSTKGGMPPEGALIAALSASCAKREAATSWAPKVAAGPDRALAEAIMRGRRPEDVSSNGPFGRRMGLHRSAVNARDPSLLTEVATTPVTTRTETVDKKPVELAFWDPCLHRALADAWFERSSAMVSRGPGWKAVGAMATEDNGLAGTLFSAWLTSEDVHSELAVLQRPGELGAKSPTARKLGVGGGAFPSDEADHGKEEVSVLDAGLNAWDARIAQEAPPEGAALVRELGAIARFRQEWLIARARVALADDQPHVAEILLEQAREEGAEGQDPALDAVLADAMIRTGQIREAMEALSGLEAAFPEILGTRQTLAALAVLQGVDLTEGEAEEP